MDKWYNKSGNEGDVIISTRIRFARILKNILSPADLMMKQNAKSPHW